MAMKIKDILTTIIELSHSQGLYGRLYEELMDLKEYSPEYWQETVDQLEEQEFSDPIEMVRYFEEGKPSKAYVEKLKSLEKTEKEETKKVKEEKQTTLRNFFNFEVYAINGNIVEKFPKSGEQVLLHDFEFTNDEHTEGQDQYELVTFWEKGDSASVGYCSPEKTPEKRLLDVVLNDRKKYQEITKTGFYWLEILDDGSSRYNWIDTKNYSHWVRLPSTKIVK